MRILLLLAVAGAAAFGAESIEAFGHKWSVPTAADWSVEGGVLHLLKGREPVGAPRRPFQFALAEVEIQGNVTVEADMKPLGKSLLIVFAYQDPAHFNYAHVSVDTGAEQPNHNGIFHVYGGERVRISSPRGRAAFAARGRWQHVKLMYSPATGRVRVLVDGEPVPALEAVDVSLGAGHVGLGSFDETGEFRGVRIGTER